MTPADPLFKTDGATLPRFFRRWIVAGYPAWVIVRIDRAGVFHDYLTDKYPRSKTHNRTRFVRQLRRYDVPLRLVRMISAGLWVYDHAPRWLAVMLRKLTP